MHKGMTRKKLIRSPFLPYHVVSRCNNREWFHLPLDVVWRITTSELYRISILYGAQVHAFVLMANHYHLLISTPEADLGVVMKEFNRAITQLFNLFSNRSGHLFGGPYKWTLIEGPTYYANALKYVYRNPVRAQIVGKVEDYPFSTLHGLLGNAPVPVPIFLPRPEIEGFSLIPADQTDALAWFNQPFLKEELEAIERGFRRKVFELSRDRKTGKLVELHSPFNAQ